MRVDGLKKLVFGGAIFLLLAPLFVFAQETTFVLKEKQVLGILDIIRKVPLSKNQGDLYFEAIYYPDSDNSAKAGAVLLTKQAILQEQLDYWLVKMPAEFSKRFIKAVYKILPAVTVGDFSGIIGLTEKYTVEQANKYIDDWMKQNQVQIGSGIGKYAFPSFKNNPQVINISYIIVYSPISATQAKVVVEFYSQKAIEPPPLKASFGCPDGVADWLTSACWPWDIWLESSYNKKSKTPNKIEPFIVRVKGQVIKDKYGNFSWDKSVEVGLQQPSVEVEFGKAVPEIDQSDIILNNLQANQSQGFIKDTINKIKQKAQGIVDQIKSFLNIFKSSSPQAQISDFVESAGDSPRLNAEPRAPQEDPQEDLQNLAKQSQEIVDQAEQVVSEPENATAYEDLSKIKTDLEQAIKEKQAELDRLLALATPLASSGQATTSPINASSSANSASSSQASLLICQATGQEPDFDKVIFNEIAWMGSIKSSSDEWIELKNISAKPIDLNGWQIFNKTQGLKIFFTTTTIVSSGGFLLLERTDDNTVPKIKADRIYTGALANTGEMLYLVGPKCILQDKIKATPYWPEGDNSTKETMERNQFFGWQTSSVIGGTPKAKNSIGKSKQSSGGGSANSLLLKPSVDTELQQQNSTSSATSTQQATSTEQATTTQNSTSSQQATSTQQATTTVQASLLDIVVNEIAWMGTQASANDEWIELYNNTDQEINLTGWKIFGIGTSPVSLTGRIPSREFYLLERTSSTTISDIIEDQIYTGALNNNGEIMELKDSQDKIIDLVDCSGGWFSDYSPASTSRKTMERKSPAVSGDNQANWASNNGTTINGLDANNNLILGTPKAQNSVLENLAPEPPQNFQLDQGQSQVNRAVLTWATSTDLDTPTSQLSYTIYYSHYSKQLLNEQTATSTNVFASIATTSATFLSIENLDFANVYYFTVRAFDGLAYSAISSTTTMTIPLAPITNLMAVPSTVRGTVDLFWDCPYFNDYSTGIPITINSYIIKMDSQPITTTSWDTVQTISQNISPKPAGEVETFSVNDLPTDQKTFFAIKYTGLPYVTSTISNVVSATAWKGFQDNGDMITDLRTNLTWQKNANSAINNYGTSTTQDNAIDFVTAQNSDWRIPNFKELVSLIEYKPGVPSIYGLFENVKLEKYWSISKRSIGGGGYTGPFRYTGWYADFSNGQIDKDYYSGAQSQTYPFMAVLGHEIPEEISVDSFDFTNNNDGTVKDNRTGLLWLKAELAQIGDNAKNWNSAFNFATNAVLCNDGTLQGTYSVVGDCSSNGGVKYDDFRLPNVQEITEMTKLGMELNSPPILIWQGGYVFYWSSTMFDENNFWQAGNDYNIGAVIYMGKSSLNNVQLVRDP